MFFRNQIFLATFATNPLVLITYMMQYPNPGILEKNVLQFQ